MRRAHNDSTIWRLSAKVETHAIEIVERADATGFQMVGSQYRR